jgi:hypothetical protein
MNRPLAFILVVPVLLASSDGAHTPTGVCSGRRQAVQLGTAAFSAMLDSVAVAWNSARPALAVSCFTETAVYLEPPDRQLYRGRRALGDFFCRVDPAGTTRSDALAYGGL